MDTYNSSSEHGTGAWQGGFAGNIWEHDEVDDDKEWIFSVGGAGWPSGFQGRPGQWCTILIDSGSSATVCGPQHFPESPIVLCHMPLGCSVCVRGRGRDCRHEAQGAEARADSESWPYIQVDYFFMKYRDEEVAQPYLSATDSKYGRCKAVKCVTRGSQDEYAVKALENFCRQLGAEKFFLQSDPEPSIQDVVGKVCAKVPGGMARTTSKQSKQSLGLAERFHGTVESDCRVLLLSVLNSYKLELLPPMHPIFDWLVRHAAWVHERFRRSRRDGRTAFARHKLREYPSQVVPFGETVIFRDTGPIKCKLRSNWNFGVWLGRDSQNDMHVLGTRQGIVKARSVKRTIQSERYDQQLLLQMRGRPYDIKGDKVFDEPSMAQLTPGTNSSSSSAAPLASSGPALATIPATSTDLPGKEETDHMDVEQQNTERRQDETVEMSPEVPTTRQRGRRPVRMSVLPKGEDSKLHCSACAGKSFYHKVGCPRREEAMQLKETMKFLRQAEREERVAKGASSGEGWEAKKAKLMEVEVPPESQTADDMAPEHRVRENRPIRSSASSTQ